MIKRILTLNLALILFFSNGLLAMASDFTPEPLAIEQTITNQDEITQRIETTNKDIPGFQNPVVLLVGIGSKDLTYRELTNLSGFEFFTVPYGVDVPSLTKSLNPAQVIIHHPSGFVGLYTHNGQLVRGVETITANELPEQANRNPQSIVKPVDANPVFSQVYYPGSLTGTVPHGGLGYIPPPRKHTIKQSAWKIAALGSLVPFQFPGFYRDLTPLDGEGSLFSALLAPIAPNIITSIAAYQDAKADQIEYDEARTQPRDYNFQPVIEAY